MSVALCGEDDEWMRKGMDEVAHIDRCMNHTIQLFGRVPNLREVSAMS